MSYLGIFIAGALVTLTVAASLSLLIWGAILDGREEARQRALRRETDLEAFRSERPFNRRAHPARRLTIQRKG